MKMNRLIIIGNGFDLAHGLKTSYKDFIDWYWEKKSDELCLCKERTLTDPLCSFKLKENAGYANWFGLYQANSFFRNGLKGTKHSGKEIITAFSEASEYIEIEKSLFFKRICTSIETKGWVDIENEYYELLKECLFQPSVSNGLEDSLNEQLQYLQDLLIEYLKTIPLDQNNIKSHISNLVDEPINDKDIAVENTGCNHDGINWSGPRPEKIMFLSFNYTHTAELYCKETNCEVNHIHGDLNDLNSIIFGYGDELDEKYKDIKNLNDNQYLDYMKSIRYLESDNYRKLLQFLESSIFQVYIWGHSCGNSDRTMLNTIFEHRNCVSIKPFYYINDKGKDNYRDLVQNMSRNFTNMKLFRDRVVNKTYCETL